MSIIKHINKKVFIIGIIVVAAIVAIALLTPSEFKRVEKKAASIAGQVRSGKDFFTIDTVPNDDCYSGLYYNSISLQVEKALDAIRYTNEALGFDSTLYSKMMNTSDEMGVQTEESDKYRASWKYSFREGLEVTYEKLRSN